jgi:hypothetical protein
MIKEHEREVNCVVAYAHADRRERVVDVWEGASRVLSQKGMRPLQASTALGESERAEGQRIQQDA